MLLFCAEKNSASFKKIISFLALLLSFLWSKNGKSQKSQEGFQPKIHKK